jgi:hypothetical protein
MRGNEMDFRSIDELLLYVRANRLAYSTVSYRDTRLVIVALKGGSDSYLFNEYTGDRE